MNLKIYAANWLYFLVFYFVLLLKNAALADVVVFLTLALHSSVIVGIMIIFYFSSGKINAAFAIILILEVLGKLPVAAGLNPKFNPLVWGMYGYSTEVYGLQGFCFDCSAVIEICFIIALTVVPIFRKNIILRGVNFERR